MTSDHDIEHETRKRADMGWRWLRKPPAEQQASNRGPQRAVSAEGYALGLRIADELARLGAISQHQPAAADAAGARPAGQPLRPLAAGRQHEAQEDREAGG